MKRFIEVLRMGWSVLRLRLSCKKEVYDVS